MAPTPTPATCTEFGISVPFSHEQRPRRAAIDRSAAANIATHEYNKQNKKTKTTGANRQTKRTDKRAPRVCPGGEPGGGHPIGDAEKCRREDAYLVLRNKYVVVASVGRSVPSKRVFVERASFACKLETATKSGRRRSSRSRRSPYRTRKNFCSGGGGVEGGAVRRTSRERGESRESGVGTAARRSTHRRVRPLIVAPKPRACPVRPKSLVFFFLLFVSSNGIRLHKACTTRVYGVSSFRPSVTYVLAVGIFRRSRETLVDRSHGLCASRYRFHRALVCLIHSRNALEPL